MSMENIIIINNEWLKFYEVSRFEFLFFIDDNLINKLKCNLEKNEWKTVFWGKIQKNRFHRAILLLKLQ